VKNVGGGKEGGREEEEVRIRKSGSSDATREGRIRKIGKAQSQRLTLAVRPEGVSECLIRNHG
jgi:hypothetical protein